MTFEEMKKIILYQRRRDYSFPTSALDELNDDERKEIERMIIEYSLQGDTFLFDHLSSLKFYDISEVFNKDVLNSFPSDKRHRIIDILYIKTRDNIYIDYLLELALQGDINAFSALTLWYEDGKIDHLYCEKIVEIFEKVSDTHPNKVYFSRMLKRIGVDKEYVIPMNEKLVLNSDILEKEELFPVRCVLKQLNSREIPVIWNYKKSHKTVLLCLHGFGGDKDSSVIAALMDKMDTEGAGVVTFDWPAHGESTAADYELTVERCLADLDAVVGFIKSITKSRICCFATSFGGYLATLYRNSHEKAFLYLILRSPALKMAEVYRGLIPDDDFERLVHGDLNEQGYERKMYLGKAFYESLLRNDAYNTEPPMPWNIKIIQGDRDDIVNPEDIIAYAERYKDKKLGLTIFEGTDHLYKKPGEKERIVQTVVWIFLIISCIQKSMICWMRKESVRKEVFILIK